MAYIKELTRTCLAVGCRKRATVEVFNYRNACLGEYCRAHGARRLAEQRKREETADATDRR